MEQEKIVSGYLTGALRGVHLSALNGPILIINVANGKNDSLLPSKIKASESLTKKVCSCETELEQSLINYSSRDITLGDIDSLREELSKLKSRNQTVKDMRFGKFMAYRVIRTMELTLEYIGQTKLIEGINSFLDSSSESTNRSAVEDGYYAGIKKVLQRKISQQKEQMRCAT